MARGFLDLQNVASARVTPEDPLLRRRTPRGRGFLEELFRGMPSWMEEPQPIVSARVTPTRPPERKSILNQLREQLHSPEGLLVEQWNSLTPEQQRGLLGSSEAVRPAAEYVSGRKIEGERLEAYKTRDERAIKGYWVTPGTEARVPLYEKPKGLERITQPLYTPITEKGIAPADILGFIGLVGSLALIGVQVGTAIRSLTEFRRLPQYKEIVRYAEEHNIPRKSRVFKDAENSLRLAINLYRRGAKEAANEIMVRFNNAYAKTFVGARPVPPSVPSRLGTFAPSVVPRGTQTGAMAFGGLTRQPREIHPIPPVIPPMAKEPWQMTAIEYRVNKRSLLSPEQQRKWSEPERVSGVKVNVENQWDAEHKVLIQQALREGKPVPPEVLADYPDLVPPPISVQTGLPEEEVIKQPFELTSTEFNARYPKLKDMTASQQKQLLDMVNETNVEVIGEEGVISLATFKKDMGDFHWDVEAAEIFPMEHKELILDAFKGGQEIPANVRVEYSKEIGEIESKRAKAQELRERRRQAKAPEAKITAPVEVPPREVVPPPSELRPSAPKGVLETLTEPLPAEPPPIEPPAPPITEAPPPSGIVPPVPPAPPEIAPVAPQAAVDDIQGRGVVAPKTISPQESKFAHIEKGAPDGPKPPKPPTEVAKAKEPDDILREITEKATPGERPDQTLLRLHEAAINNESRRVNIIIQKGNQKLKDLGVGVTKRGFLVPREEDLPVLDALYNALHNPTKVASGEIAIPKGYEAIYNELRGLTDWEQSARLDFDPEMATVEDYFYRGWKPPEGAFTNVQQGRPLVKTPAFAKHRVDATYQEMRAAGFEPLFWNPYQQWGLSRTQGTKYREQMELVSYLKGMGNEFIRPDSGGSLPIGWKIPKIGPAFEGKPFAAIDPTTGEPTVMFTRRWIVPDNIANSLENIYGKRPEMGKFIIGKKTIDPLNIIDIATFLPKRAKLFLSFFQQVDFLTRAGAGSWTGMVDSLMAGKPVSALTSVARFPATAWEILKANFSPGARLKLSEHLDSTKPIIKERPGINLKGISEAGLSTMDVTIFPADMDKMVRQVAQNTGILSKGKGIVTAIGDLESAMRRGLFQGVYPAAITTDIEKNIAPTIARQFPEMNDAQINGMIARIANIKYSTIPASQSVFQNTFLRETLRRIFFSVGESEGLLRQATGAIKGPYSSFWRKHWLGVYLFLIVTANIIHFASTRESLPAERYSPIAKDNWGPLPFGYNTKFASPTLPWRGRGDVELTLDLVGQMDTAFRILDPGFFLSARTNVPIRALVNQVSGTDFYGAPIDDVGPGGIVSRTTQLILDLFSPIGVGGIATETLRQRVLGAEEIIPEGESRLGMLGLGIQATGVNIRAELTRELLDRYARESGLLKADGTKVQSWADLEPSQKDKVLENKELVKELSLRSETSVERGYPGAAGFATLEQLDQQRIERGEALVTEFEAGEYEAGEFPKEVTKLKVEIASKKAQVDEDFQLFQENQELPEDPNKRALVEYYTIFDNAKRQSQVIDWDKVEQLESELRATWTVEQEAYVDRNTGLTEWGMKMQEYINAQETLKLSGYWEIEEPNQYQKRQSLRRQNPEIEAILVKWYGYKPVTAPSKRRPKTTQGLRIPSFARPETQEQQTPKSGGGVRMPSFAR